MKGEFRHIGAQAHRQIAEERDDNNRRQHKRETEETRDADDLTAQFQVQAKILDILQTKTPLGADAEALKVELMKAEAYLREFLAEDDHGL
jgi:hypothetical protein